MGQGSADSSGAPTVRHRLDDFARLPLMDGPELSPDGRHVLAEISLGGQQYLAVLAPFDQGVEPRLMKEGDSDILWWQWVNDDWAIAALGEQVPFEGEEVYVRRLVAIETKTMKVVKIKWDVGGQNAADVLWVAHDGSPEILLAYQKSLFLQEDFWPTVSLIDVRKGQSRDVVRPSSNVMDWYADGAGNVRMGIRYNDIQRSSQLLYRSSGTGAFHVVDRVNFRNDESMTVPALFLADPNKAIAFDDGEGFDALYNLDLTNLKLGDRIFDVPGYDVDSIISNADKSGLAGVRYVDTRRRTHWFDPSMAEVQAEIDKALGKRTGEIVSMDRTWSRFIVEVGAADQPPTYYLYSPKDGAMFLLARQHEALRNVATNPVKTITYKARDGLEIHAVLTLPKGREAKGLPLILLPHGGPFARDSESWDWWTQFLADRGYAVIQPNYRGSSGYGKDFARKGEGQWGLAMQDDLNDAVDWAVAQGIADAKRVCIVGGSYGGYAALRGAQRDSEKFRCAVSFAGVSDLGAMRRYDGRFLNSGRGGDWLHKQVPDFKAVSPLNFPEQFSTPVLLVHGAKDMRVPVRQSRRMADALREAGKTYRYFELPLGDHHLSREADRVTFLQELEAFLAKYNPA